MSRQIAARATLRVAAFYSKRDRVKYEKVNNYFLYSINSTISIIFLTLLLNNSE